MRKSSLKTCNLLLVFILIIFTLLILLIYRLLMYQFDNLLIDDNIVSTYFACNLKKCKGACCTFPGEYGAPLLDEEIAVIESCLEEAKKHLSRRSIKVLERDSFYSGKPGKYTTVCIDKRDCVFVYYEGDIALCALEKAYNEGKTRFKKPLSCHLFPIRVGNFGGKYMYYEKIDECTPALENGKINKISMINFLTEPLERFLGKEKLCHFIDFCNNCKNNI